MKIDKKVIITAVLVAVVIISGILVWVLRSNAELQVGSIFNGENIEWVVDGDIVYSDVEEEIAERTRVYIVSMESLSDTEGKVKLKITTLDVADEIAKAAETAKADNKEQFIKELSKIMHDKIDNGEITKNCEPVVYEADIVFKGSTWKIALNDELEALFKGDITAQIEAAYGN